MVKQVDDKTREGVVSLVVTCDFCKATRNAWGARWFGKPLSYHAGKGWAKLARPGWQERHKDACPECAVQKFMEGWVEAKV